MPKYEHKDRFYRKAKEQGLPSRASFKLEEILKKFRLVKPGGTVLDLGAAPGGWTAILSQAVGPSGLVLAIDLEKLSRRFPPQVRFLQGDLQAPESRQWLEAELANRKVALLCSDMSPKLSGIAFRDYHQSYQCGRLAWELAREFLMPGGSLIVKQFPGEEFAGFLKELRSHFKQVKVFEPEATRKSSKEVYLIAQHFQKL